MMSESSEDNRQIVYFFGAATGKFAGRTLKLGITDNLRTLSSRQNEHEKILRIKSEDKTAKMELLAAYFSTNAKSDETALKHHWKVYASDDSPEWFYDTPPVMRDWIAKFRLQTGVATSFEQLADLFDRKILPCFNNLKPKEIEAGEGNEFIQLDSQQNSWNDVKIPEYRDSNGDFYTSAKIISAVRKVMGGIDLDPASCKLANSGDTTKANPGVNATRFFDFNDNGLSKEWSGRVWLNPPFNQWNRWAPKLIKELDSGRVTEACVLIPIRTLSALAMKELKSRCDRMMIPNGREEFWGHKAQAPDQGHCVLYFGPNKDKFLEAFTEIGQHCVDFCKSTPQKPDDDLIVFK